ncbi:hypothetical protein GCM10029978_109860 [Actinoallomurus acanthiterrae]
MPEVVELVAPHPAVSEAVEGAEPHATVPEVATMERPEVVVPEVVVPEVVVAEVAMMVPPPPRPVIAVMPPPPRPVITMMAPPPAVMTAEVAVPEAVVAPDVTPDVAPDVAPAVMIARYQGAPGSGLSRAARQATRSAGDAGSGGHRLGLRGCSREQYACGRRAHQGEGGALLRQHIELLPRNGPFGAWSRIRVGVGRGAGVATPAPRAVNCHPVRLR